MNEFHFDAKVFDSNSYNGIDGGRVSKLTVYDEDKQLIVNYDRGWDIVPESAEQINCLDNIIQMLETL